MIFLRKTMVRPPEKRRISCDVGQKYVLNRIFRQTSHDLAPFSIEGQKGNEAMDLTHLSQGLQLWE